MVIKTVVAVNVKKPEPIIWLSRSNWGAGKAGWK